MLKEQFLSIRHVTDVPVLEIFYKFTLHCCHYPSYFILFDLQYPFPHNVVLIPIMNWYFVLVNC